MSPAALFAGVAPRCGDPGLSCLTPSRDPRGQVAAALARLRQLREGIVLEGDIKAMAREGLDG